MGIFSRRNPTFLKSPNSNFGTFEAILGSKMALSQNFCEKTNLLFFSRNTFSQTQITRLTQNASRGFQPFMKVKIRKNTKSKEVKDHIIE